MPALIAAALAAGCAEPRTEPAAEDSTFVIEGMEENAVEPYVSPEDSAAAAQARRAHEIEMTRRIRGPDSDTQSVPYVDTPEKKYASCMAQARGLDEPTRSAVLASCERYRRGEQ